MDCLKLSITEMASKGLAKNHRTGTGEFSGFFSSKRETIRQRVRGTTAGKEAVCLTACLNTAVRFDDATHISAKKKYILGHQEKENTNDDHGRGGVEGDGGRGGAKV